MQLQSIIHWHSWTWKNNDFQCPSAIEISIIYVYKRKFQFDRPFGLINKSHSCLDVFPFFYSICCYFTKKKSYFSKLYATLLITWVFFSFVDFFVLVLVFAIPLLIRHLFSIVVCDKNNKYSIAQYWRLLFYSGVSSINPTLYLYNRLLFLNYVRKLLLFISPLFVNAFLSCDWDFLSSVFFFLFLLSSSSLLPIFFSVFQYRCFFSVCFTIYSLLLGSLFLLIE